jgi:hypothetical protein
MLQVSCFIMRYTNKLLAFLDKILNFQRYKGLQIESVAKSSELRESREGRKEVPPLKKSIHIKQEMSVVVAYYSLRN